ncbi:MAG: hypothetical protein JW727_03165 [Candidatus Aenigmarchaeota archaeon]|nr:hypothetical protein [Candidatus Aenigmarchaeota archaeon]
MKEEDIWYSVKIRPGVRSPPRRYHSNYWWDLEKPRGRKVAPWTQKKINQVTHEFKHEAVNAVNILREGVCFEGANVYTGRMMEPLPPGLKQLDLLCLLEPTYDPLKGPSLEEVQPLSIQPLIKDRFYKPQLVTADIEKPGSSIYSNFDKEVVEILIPRRSSDSIDKYRLPQCSPSLIDPESIQTYKYQIPFKLFDTE